MVRIGVVGAGSWGTTLANLLAKKGHQVVLWAYEPELAAEMPKTHINSLYLPDVLLDQRLAFTNDLVESVKDKDLLLFVTPSQVLRPVLRTVAPHIAEGTPVVCASKGIEVDSLKTMAEVFQELLPPAIFASFAALSGPSFAAEVSREMPTAVAVAASSSEVAEKVQQIFSTSYFRVYTNEDVVGVELGGSIKNVIALAAGISDGLGFGHNTRAALITRGLAEMARLGRAMGADPATFAGLAGMGDLVLTCTGDLSRNRTVGFKLGQGQKLEEILAEMRMVAEGVKTTESTFLLAQKLRVDMPITETVYRILREGKSAREAVLELMTRMPKPEVR